VHLVWEICCGLVNQEHARGRIRSIARSGAGFNGGMEGVSPVETHGLMSGIKRSWERIGRSPENPKSSPVNG